LFITETWVRVPYAPPKNKGYEMDGFVYLGSAIYPSIEEYNDIL